MTVFSSKRLIHLSLAILIYSQLSCARFTDVPSSSSEPVVLSGNYYSDLYAWNEQGGLQHTKLGRGLNLGNYLDAPVEGEWTGGRRLVKEDLQRISNAGFKNVRIPIRWSVHADVNTPYTVDSIFMERVKEVVGWAHDANLKVILNVHHYTKMIKAQKSEQDAHICRLQGIWKQISEHFPLSKYPHDNLVFELFNEPHGNISYQDWNNIIARLLNLIWGDMAALQNNGDTQRIVMIGAANWNDPNYLTKLALPESVNSSNTIITVHYYKPFHFTHQGANWVTGSTKWIGTAWLGTKNDQSSLIRLFDKVTHWNKQPNRGFEIFMGEFGVYSRYSDPVHQKAWTAFIAREAEKRNISWAYWEYAAGFGAYNSKEEQWRPQLIEALIPTH